MTTLRGRAHIRMDPKGRLSLPTSFRGGLGKTSTVFVTNSIFQGRRFLDLYSKAEWEKLEKKIGSMPALKSEVLTFQRYYLSSGEACGVDSQGRLLIPQHLREYATLADDVVLVGMNSKLEIWSHSAWAELFGRLEGDFEKAMDVLAALEENKGAKK